MDNYNFTRYCFCSLLAFTLCLWTGCKSTAQYGTGVGDIGYLRPESVETADYAIRERIGELERQIANARTAVREIRASSETIRAISRRSVNDVQSIIDKMEALALWVDWAVDRIQYLESLLTIEVQDTVMVRGDN